MTGFYLEQKNLIFSLAILSPLILSIIHYVLCGPKQANARSTRDVRRFGITERILHLIRMLSFLIVSITGLIFVFAAISHETGIVHSINGMIFALISIITLIIWFRDNLFSEYDSRWLSRMGGYFSKGQISLPAGKFNAGQKVLFWLTMVLTILLLVTGIILLRGEITKVSAPGWILVSHGLAAALIIMLVIGHIYLALVANPGTWKVLINGKVSEEWAKHHHPDWNPGPRKNR